jgi:hypothetical protein
MLAFATGRILPSTAAKNLPNAIPHAWATGTYLLYPSLNTGVYCFNKLHHSNAMLGRHDEVQNSATQRKLNDLTCKGFHL